MNKTADEATESSHSGRRGGEGGGEGEEGQARLAGEVQRTQRKHTADRRQPTTHKSVTVKRQDAEKWVSGGEAEPELRAAWRGDVSGIRERDARAEEEEVGGGRRQAWPNLARLMKNGQESAYLACLSLPTPAPPPPRFLLLLLFLLPGALTLPPSNPSLLHPPTFKPSASSACLSSASPNTLISAASPFEPPSPTNTDVHAPVSSQTLFSTCEFTSDVCVRVCACLCVRFPRGNNKEKHLILHGGKRRDD